ncbi:MAG: glutathione S-transferase family protein [Alphaproteobacteria bacterium]|nr:glutathione S-transferase family protein [Alphaproteobacteria bacterium]
MSDVLRLYYWPSLPGRGEYVRLVLEHLGLPYVDVARLAPSDAGGVAAVVEARRGALGGVPAFAPPYLQHGALVLAQMPSICAWLSERHDLAPPGPDGRALALQLMLSVADVVDEVHQTHHPIAVSLHFEEQQEAALRAGRLFARERIPIWLAYFERVVEASGGPWLLGARPSYPDLGLFQTVEGLRHAFPRTTARVVERTPRVLELVEAVRELDRVGEYLASERRLGFGQAGIFRRYAGMEE